MGAKGKRVRGAEVGEGSAEKRRWERRELGIGRGAENSGELPDEDHQAQERRDQSYWLVRTELGDRETRVHRCDSRLPGLQISADSTKCVPKRDRRRAELATQLLGCKTKI